MTADQTPFHDLTDFVAIPRTGALRLAPDGSWLAATVQTLSPDKKKYLTSIWRIDVAGGPPRRLTRSAEGEGSPRFLPDGSLLFTSKRHDPAKAKDEAAEAPSLWLLSAGGGEAGVVAALPGGISAAEVAREAGRIVVSSPVLPAASSNGASSNGADSNGARTDDEQLRKERKDAGVTAILHDSAPVRYWDHDLGPDQPRLFALDSDQALQTEVGWAGGDKEPQVSEDAENAATAQGAERAAFTARLRDLTPDPGRALDDQDFELTPDGTSVVTGWWEWDPAGDSHSDLVLIDVATGKRRVLLSEPHSDFGSPRISPDGRFIACLREIHDTPDQPLDITLVLIDTEGPEDGAAQAGQTAAGRDLLPGLDRWPHAAAWGPDSRTLYFTADDGGRGPVFRVDVESTRVDRVTDDDGNYTDLNPAPDGRYLYALRSAVDSPPTPVRIDLTTGAEPAPLECPGLPVHVPGRCEDVSATADDGHPIRSWLVLPEGASPEHPAPLLLWVHGGPLSSWNSWSWRWNPWLMAARGYAVLLPDPALSTGYGRDFVARGHREWAARPMADIMAATEAAAGRPDIDADQVAMMGGSYGGYMANWMAGHTDRFRAIVSHAGLWHLDQMFGTTDHPMFWRRQFGDPLRDPAMYQANSPHQYIGQISTPMLVIHGNKDYRVPVGEALRLWWDLTSHGAEAKFLYFPDENHWILTPGNARIWYETVFAFLAQHVLGQEWERPRLL
ncbi:MAG: S9 family peptidase [Streptosporangiaceae bacterium]